MTNTMAPEIRVVPKIKAHRGASITAPENTATAVRLAFQEGADACEIDVRRSKDGAIVVFHDEDTKRIGGRNSLVAEQTLAELRELDIGGWKSARYAGERIVTLAEIISFVPPGKTLFVEIKDGVEVVPNVLQAIENTPTKGRIAIESFSAEVLEAVAKVAPSLPLHMTLAAQKDSEGRPIGFPASLARRAKELGFDGLSVDVYGMTPAFAEAVRVEGLDLAVWTVNEPAMLRELRALPITWIETDAPASISKALLTTDQGPGDSRP